MRPWDTKNVPNAENGSGREDASGGAGMNAEKRSAAEGKMSGSGGTEKGADKWNRTR
jgi:hypothetical protein